MDATHASHAAGDDVVAIPLAAGVLVPWGVVLGPAVGAVRRWLGPIIVPATAQRQRPAPAAGGTVGGQGRGSGTGGRVARAAAACHA